MGKRVLTEVLRRDKYVQEYVDLATDLMWEDHKLEVTINAEGITASKREG